ncbi:amino acid adenylation domain-containing protein [Micromonospora marina]
MPGITSCTRPRPRSAGWCERYPRPAMTSTDADRPSTTLDLFRLQVARTPDAVAVRTEAEKLTYRDLDYRSDQIACLIDSAGPPGDLPVGVCLRRTADLLPTLIGIWKAGRPYLPLDPDLPPRRARGMAARGGCTVIVSHSEHRELLAALDGVRPLLLDAEQGPSTGVITARALRPEDAAYIMFTSGSTGEPKGVVVEHRGLTNYLLWAAREYGGSGTGGSPYFTSIGFDLGVPSLFAPLIIGQAVHLLPDPLDPADLAALLVAGGPYAFVKMTPGHLNLISLDLSAAEARKLAGVVIAAGDAFPYSLAARWRALAGPGGTDVATEYGPTEITIGNSGMRVPLGNTDGLVPLGSPIPHTMMYVLDDHLDPVPSGVPGEVYIGGIGVARGYLGDPALTAQRFLPNPYGEPGARLYRSGDRARQVGDDLYFLGRTDDQVKIRGHRVELAEVATALQRHPDIREAIVVDRLRNTHTELAGFVVAAPAREVDVAELRAAVAAELPGYMIPAQLRVVDRLPLTANGKIDRAALLRSLEDNTTPAARNTDPDVVEFSYQVVRNDNDQYSLWDAGRPPPRGWRSTGVDGSRADCLAHIASVWQVDARSPSAEPRSTR